MPCFLRREEDTVRTSGSFGGGRSSRPQAPYRARSPLGKQVAFRFSESTRPPGLIRPRQPGHHQPPAGASGLAMGPGHLLLPTEQEAFHGRFYRNNPKEAAHQDRVYQSNAMSRDHSDQYWKYLVTFGGPVPRSSRFPATEIVQVNLRWLCAESTNCRVTKNPTSHWQCSLFGYWLLVMVKVFYNSMPCPFLCPSSLIVLTRQRQSWAQCRPRLVDNKGKRSMPFG
jgi:hypothetical protein